MIVVWQHSIVGSFFLQMKLTIKNRFGVAPNDLLNDKNISLKAKGLYTYIQSKPEGWRFSVKRMAAEHKDSIDGISVAVKELEQHGYLQRNKYQNERGAWVIEYVLYDIPIREIPVQEIPRQEIPSKEIPETYKTIDTKQYIQNNIKESAPDKFCFLTELIKMGLAKTLASEWMKIRKKSKNTEKALELFKNELNKSGLNINDFVSIAVAHGWQMPKSNYEEVRIAKIKQNDIEKRKNDFKAVLSEFVGKVNKDTLNDFYRYYTQANDENIMLFEQIAFFNVAYRLFNHKKNK